MILTGMSSIIHKLVKRYNVLGIIGISFLIYVIAYIQRIKGIWVVEQELLEWVVRQLALWGTSQFPFVVGCIFAHKTYYSKVARFVNQFQWKNLFGSLIILGMVVGHGLVQTLFVAPFTGIVFIIVFNAMEHTKVFDRVLSYISKHSTNMWLTHMFFYMIYFENIVYAPRYPLLIFIWLVILCIVSSYLINYCIQVVNKIQGYRK